MRSILLALAAACCTLPARAEIVVYEYTAYINRLVINDYWSDAYDVSSISVLPQPLTLGDKVTGRISFDTTPREILYFNDIDLAYYGSSPSPVASSVTFNDSWGWTGPKQTGMYEVANARNYRTSDQFIFGVSLWNNGPSLQLNLTDPTATAFAHRGPPANLDLADFADAYVYIHEGFWPYVDDDIRDVGVYARLTGLTRVAAVPEPETYAMLLAGMAVVAGARWRRRSAAPA